MSNDTNILGYHPGSTFFHQLNGTTKILGLVLLTLIGMISFNTWYLILLCVLSVVAFISAKIKWQEVRTLTIAIILFTLLNLVLIYAFGPNYGSALYHSRHVIIGGNSFFALTWEELFYLFNMFLKYLFAVPLVYVFLFTTNPSEFAASLNRIGIPYKISYSIAIALRYIPDVQYEFHQISLSQQARGLELSKKAHLWRRLTSSSRILIPLIFNSLDRIETVSRAMRLRRFGTRKTRTWYMNKPGSKKDWWMLGIIVGLTILGLLLFIVDSGRYFNPFK
ncbi:energy-coupling factor transporter transmembrane component T family protein [Pediococcus argentinicus]|uniref:Cobalt transport protein n=1 Tax=Pediococcus argentinicus TaxID=480391 RepID=A0A0R2NKQ3_9LACO|nr:energy-coupling factor transporter transmembrane component T [Pediococcus argentinicus]KRO24605.1 cobalt transport protein [Pediococcus argentinicus]NKZ22819.1 energy-coupling factor transporter transmembrane protein EcfT [Pediococcus argentinicus]GEP19841.1 ABC transporter permease [Pediococcus argentinicus]